MNDTNYRIAELEDRFQQQTLAMATSLISLIDLRDCYTGGHSARVAKYVRGIAVEMALPEDETETMEFPGFAFQTRSIGFVRGDEHRLCSFSQPARQLFIQGGYSFARVNDPNQGTGFFDCHSRLFENIRRNGRIIVGDYSSGIHECESLSIPLGFAVDAITRYPWFVTDDRPPLADQAIKQRGLAHVGPADNCYQRQLSCSRFGHREGA